MTISLVFTLFILRKVITAFNTLCFLCSVPMIVVFPVISWCKGCDTFFFSFFLVSGKLANRERERDSLSDLNSLSVDFFPPWVCVCVHALVIYLKFS